MFPRSIAKWKRPRFLLTVPFYEGEIATYWFEGKVLVSLSKNVKRTVELIRGNVELVRTITKGKPVPLLI
jgi:hypothetical protein